MNSFIKFLLSLFENKKKNVVETKIVAKPATEEKDGVIDNMSKYERLDKPYKLSKSGEDRLKQCCSEIQSVIKEVLYYRDITILCGYRSKEEQEKMFMQGASKAHAGQSAHNYQPSLAIDVVPYPIPMKDGKWDNDASDWKDLSNLIFDIAKSKNIDLTWGGNWKKLVDKPHYEITDWKNKV